MEGYLGLAWLGLAGLLIHAEGKPIAFARVTGDSMESLGMLDGEVAILPPGAPEGTRGICVIQIDGSVFVKWVVYDRLAKTTYIYSKYSHGQKLVGKIHNEAQNFSVIGEVLGLLRNNHLFTKRYKRPIAYA